MVKEHRRQFQAEYGREMKEEKRGKKRGAAALAPSVEENRRDWRGRPEEDVGGVELQFRAAFADDTVVPFAPMHEPGSFVVIRRLARSGATGLYLVKPAAQPLPHARVFLVRITTDENATLNWLKRSGS